MKLSKHHEELLVEEESERAALPPDDVKTRLSLPELIDAALHNSPKTKISWATAKANAANWGRARSGYYPSIDGNVQGAIGEIPALQGGRSYLSTGVTLSYLLLDFGGRSAKAEAARQALIAANWNHNQAIQDLLGDVPKAYYKHTGDKAKLKAAKKSLEEAETVLAATELRLKSGVSTISDVLQAKANAAESRFDLASRQGDVDISKGRLATIIGWPANTRFETMDETGSPPLRMMSKDVDKLTDEAMVSRPAIAAAQAMVRQKEAELIKAETLHFPEFTGIGNLTWQQTRNNDNLGAYGGLNIEIPIFHGFDTENAIRAARAELDAARAKLKLEEDNVIEEVWDAASNFKTAKEQLSAAETLLASAGESYEASLARYRAGAADIVELLNAQSTLADARAKDIDARMELFISYADLVHAVGMQIHEGLSEDISYEKDE